MEEWVEAHPEDKELMEGLSASGLSSWLKAKKRRALSEELQALAKVRVETQLKIGRAEARETDIQDDRPPARVRLVEMLPNLKEAPDFS